MCPKLRDGAGSAQAAVDFLTSYGLALIVIAIAVAVIYQISVSHPTLSASSCAATPGFACDAYALNTSGAMQLTLSQATGGPIIINGVACSSQPSSVGSGPAYGNAYVSNSAAYYPTVNGVNTAPSGIFIFSGSGTTLSVNCYSQSGRAAGQIGSGFTGYIWLNYTVPGYGKMMHQIASVSLVYTGFVPKTTTSTSSTVTTSTSTTSTSASTTSTSTTSTSTTSTVTPTTIIYTSSGTFSVPSGVDSIDFIIVGGSGAGGNGGSASVSNVDKNHPSGCGGGGGGGGGSGYVTTATGISVTPGASLPVTVGLGGAVSGSCSGSPGGTGGTSSITVSGNVYSASGGTGGGRGGDAPSCTSGGAGNSGGSGYSSGGSGGTGGNNVGGNAGTGGPGGSGGSGYNFLGTSYASGGSGSTGFPCVVFSCTCDVDGYSCTSCGSCTSASPGNNGMVAISYPAPEYSKQITITNNNGTTTLNNYPVLLSVSYVSGHMQSDYSDIRFTNAVGVNLPFWIESYDSSSANVWVNVDSIPGSGTTIYMYYGYQSVYGSNGIQTFDLFDDFGGSSIDMNKWSVYNGVSPSTPSNSLVTINDGATQDAGLVSNYGISDPKNYQLRVRFELLSIGGGQYPSDRLWMSFVPASPDWNNIPYAVAYYQDKYNGRSAQQLYSEYTDSYYTGFTFSPSTFYTFSETMSASYVPTVNIGSTTYTGGTAQSSAYSHVMLGGEYVDGTVDWVMVRKYARNGEPTYSFSPEQTNYR